MNRTIDDEIRGELFVDMLQQAIYLCNEGFYVASAVISRSILENKLKTLCNVNNCIPNKQKPMLGDFINSLKNSNIINTVREQHLRSLALIGNNAAHNATADKIDVERMTRYIESLLVNM
jgi:hypothetical protein